MKNNVYNFFKNYGLVATVRHASNKAFSNFLPPCGNFFCANLTEIQLSLASEDPSIRIKPFQSLKEVPLPVQEELFLSGTIDDRKPYSRERVAHLLSELFSRGAVYWACFEGNKLVGHLWTLRGLQKNPPIHFFPLGTRDVVFLAHEIFPPYRGRGLNRKMTFLALKEMEAGGVERVYIDVLLTNTPALKSFRKTFFKPIGQARLKNIKKRKIVVWKRQEQPKSPRMS